MPSLSWANRVLFAFVLLVQLFFLVTGPAVFPGFWYQQAWDKWMPIYLALSVGAIALSTFLSGKGYAAKPFGDPFGIFPLVEVFFLIGFFGSFLLFQIPALKVPHNLPSADATSTVLMHFAVISFSEELLFRWFLLGLLHYGLGLWSPRVRFLAVPMSSAAWAAFHLLAYGEQPYTILYIFLIGIVFGFLYLATRDRGGIGATWGAHLGENLGSFGIFTLGLGLH
jgi:membrane protease YdiL (CAAX protease family)